MISSTGRTAKSRPAMQNFPGTPASVLERAVAGQPALITCAHCGSRELSELGRRDHLCMGALLDWFSFFDSGAELPLDIWIDQFLSYIAHLDRC